MADVTTPEISAVRKGDKSYLSRMTGWKEAGARAQAAQERQKGEEISELSREQTARLQALKEKIAQRNSPDDMPAPGSLQEFTKRVTDEQIRAQSAPETVQASLAEREQADLERFVNEQTVEPANELSPPDLSAVPLQNDQVGNRFAQETAQQKIRQAEVLARNAEAIRKLGGEPTFGSSLTSSPASPVDVPSHVQTATSTLGSPARDIQPPALTIDQTRQVMIENSVKVKQERQAYLGRLRQMKDSFAARLRGANVNSMPEILRPSSSVAEKPGLADAPLIVRKDQDGYHIDDVQNPDVLGNERPSSRDYLREIQADRTSLVRKDAPTIHERAKANLGRLIGLIKRG